MAIFLLFSGFECRETITEGLLPSLGAYRSPVMSFIINKMQKFWGKKVTV